MLTPYFAGSGGRSCQAGSADVVCLWDLTGKLGRWVEGESITV